MKKMTTKALQAHHSGVYQQFFVNNDLVLSVPSVFSWSHCVVSGCKPDVHMVQKLPLQMFVGLSYEKTDEQQQSLTVQTYLPVLNEFIFQSFSEVMGGDIADKLHSFVQQNLSAFPDLFGSVHFLSEQGRISHCDAKRSICTGVALMICYVRGELKNVSSLLPYEIKKIWILSCRCRAAVFLSPEGDLYGGLHPYVMLTGSEFPVIYAGKSLMERNSQNDVVLSYDHTMLKDLKDVHQGSLDRRKLGIEFCIIEGSVLSDSFDESDYSPSFDTSEDPYSQLFQQLSRSLESSLGFYENVLSKAIAELYRYLHCPTKFYAIQVIESFQRVGLLSIAQQDEKELYIACVSLFLRRRSFSSEKIALVPLSTRGMLGKVLCISKSGLSRETVERVIEEMRLQYSWRGVISFATRRDSFSHVGASIHQDQSQGVLSGYVPEHAVVYINPKGNKQLQSYQEIVSHKYSGILLDGITKKIYCNGKKLTSRDICSQTATVDILMRLMGKCSREISNRQLDRSTYSKNKNEMINKILLPFQQFIKKTFSADLVLSCSGGIHDFFVRLECVTIPIHRVVKI